jgi:hypothetical protein
VAGKNTNLLIICVSPAGFCNSGIMLSKISIVLDIAKTASLKKVSYSTSMIFFSLHSFFIKLYHEKFYLRIHLFDGIKF